MPGSIPRRSSYQLASFFTLIAYVDLALIGCLDVRPLASRILGTWKHCGVMDYVSYAQGPPPARFNCLFEQGVGEGGGVEGCIGLPTMQPLPCLSGSCVGGEGHGLLVYQIYLVYRELCHLVQYTFPIALPPGAD